MAKAHFNFDDFTLTYDLIDNEVSTLWQELLLETPFDLMCKDNHKSGFETREEVLRKTDRLYELAALINGYVPDGITLIKLDESNWKEALNKLHVHFPMLHTSYAIPENEFKSVLLPALEEYNDLIHWLEKAYDRIFGSQINMSTIYCDFNKTRVSRFVQIPESGYELFTPLTDFGTLCVHYAHVGRHPFELLAAQDYDCPSDQVLPQNQMTASCAMYFHDRDFHRIRRWGADVNHLQKINEAFAAFYSARGGREFFGYELADPHLAFGYMKIGQLTNIDLFSTLEARDELRARLTNATLTSITIS